MKRKTLLVVLSIVCAAFCAFGLTACAKTTNESEHKHAYSSQWSYDGEYHWHNATCEHTTEINGRAVHTFVGDECTVCRYKKSGAENPTDPQKTYKTVGFDLNGGNGSLDDMQFAVGEVMSALPYPTRDGYTFVCWVVPFTGEEYTAASVMPNVNLSLTALWEKNVTDYKDEYVSFSPASDGYKNSVIAELYAKDVDKFVYVEITSDDLSGNVGENNNFTLRTIDSMEYKVSSGYNWMWYQGNFNNPNGAQRFTLNYGSNIQFITVSDNSGVVRQTYLLDIYVRHDYYVSLYENIFEEKPYDKIRVIENDRFSADTEAKESMFEFDGRVYYNNATGTYEKFVYSTAITKNWNLYQSYKDITVPAELDGGTLEKELSIKPYTQYFTLPSPQKDGYDFLGWQTRDGKYLTNVQGYSGKNYISDSNKPDKLTAVYAKKKYYYALANDILKTVKTVPVVTYTDKTMREIAEICYTPYNTDCVLPVKTTQNQNEAFTGWAHYCLSDKGEFGKNLSEFDFDTKITAPLALAPNTATASATVVPLNGELISGNTGSYTMYLPANKTYTLTVTATNSATLTINNYGATTNGQTFTVTSSAPKTVNLNYYVYNFGAPVLSHGYVTFNVTSLSGSFTARLSGDTANTSGNPVVTDKNNLAEVGEEFTVNVSTNKLGYVFDCWKETGNESATLTMENREICLTQQWKIDPVLSNFTYILTETSCTITEVKDKTKTELIIPDYVTGIVSSMFNDCNNLKYKEYNNALYLGNANNPYIVLIKAKNTDITNCNIHSKTKFICDSAFKDCSDLSRITLPSGVISIGSSAFYGCILSNLTIPNGVTSIEDQTFYGCIGLSSITIPNSVTSIGNRAFYGCTGLSSITIPNSVTSIGDLTFKNCIKLKSLTIQNGITNISYCMFQGCSSLTSITIPSSVTSIGSSAFDGCKGLTSITLSDNITNIGDFAFSNCSELTNINIPSNVTSIGNSVFSNCNNLLYNEYENALYLGNTSNPYVVLVKSKNTDITYCIINKKTKFIYDSAFSACSNLTSISIPNSVTSIGNSAFSACSNLTSISIPNSVTSIGNSAFSACNSLTSISVAKDNTNYHSLENCIIETASKTLIFGYKNSVIPTDGSVTSIGNYAFSNCLDLSNITIPNSVTSIGNWAFRSCINLTNITIPNSVTNIGTEAFCNCFYLTSITFQGTKAQWNAISKGSQWDDNTFNYTITCTDGTIAKS